MANKKDTVLVLIKLLFQHEEVDDTQDNFREGLRAMMKTKSGKYNGEHKQVVREASLKG